MFGKVALIPLGFRHFGANAAKYDTCTFQSLELEMTGGRRNEIKPAGFVMLEGEQIKEH